MSVPDLLRKWSEWRLALACRSPGRDRGPACGVMGLTFPSAIGVAAGVDRTGALGRRLGRLGFGFIDVGTVTLRPEKGRGAPLAQVRENLLRSADGLTDHDRRTVLGLTIGPSLGTEPERAAAEAVVCAQGLTGLAEYFTLSLCRRRGCLGWSPDEAARVIHEVGQWVSMMGPVAIKLPAHPATPCLAKEAARAGFTAVVAENAGPAAIAVLSRMLPVIAVGGVKLVAGRRRSGVSLVACCRPLLLGGPAAAQRLLGGAPENVAAPKPRSDGGQLPVTPSSPNHSGGGASHR